MQEAKIEKRVKVKKHAHATPPESPPVSPLVRSASPTHDVQVRRNACKYFNATIAKVTKALEVSRDEAEAYTASEKFIFTFRRFISSRRLTRLLIKGLRERRLVCGEALLVFSNVWIRSRIDSHRIERNSTFYGMVSAIARSPSGTLSLAASRVVCSVFQALRRQNTVAMLSPDLPPSLKVPVAPSGESPAASNTGNIGKLWSHSTGTLAIVMAYVEWGHFVAVPFAEFELAAISGVEKCKDTAPALHAYIERSSRMSEWVASTVLAQTTPRARTLAIEAFILLAADCLRIGNYSSSFAICNGFAIGPLARLLPGGFIHVARKYRLLSKRNEEVTSPTRGYSTYQQHINERIKAGERVVPLTPAILKSITLVEQANPDIIPETMAINIEKINMLHSVLDVRYRTVLNPYPMDQAKLTTLYSYPVRVFQRLPRLSSEDLEKISVSIKPYKHIDGGTDSIDGSSTDSLASGASMIGDAASGDSDSHGRDELIDLIPDSSSSDQLLNTSRSRALSSSTNTVVVDIRSE